MSKSKFMGRLLQSTVLAGAAIAVAAPVMAQDDQIVITGTRIQRTDLESPSPVTTVGEQELKLSNAINNENFLNSLPQAIPGFDSTSNNPGNGTATVNLRNLGASRTLVLVDGHRWVNYDGGGIVDLNSIPSSLVQRIDVVTGGASAVYGSDAMAGVVNFILKDDFEGLELATSYQTTEQSDGQIFDVSLIAGGQFADGRGHATLAMGYTERKAVFAADRDVTNFVAVDNGDGSTAFGEGGSSGVPGTRIFDAFDFTTIGYSTDGTTCTAPAGASSSGLNGSCIGGATFLSDGTPTPWIGAGNPGTTAYNYAPVNYLQLPQERYNTAAFVSYDITDNVTFDGRAVFSSNVVAQELAPTPFFSTVILPGNAAGLTTDLRAFLATSSSFVDVDGDGIFDTEDSLPMFIGRRMVEVGPRNAKGKIESLQMAGGLNGSWINGWDWELFGSFSKTAGSAIQTGNVSISAMQQALDSGNCDIFGTGNFSDDCVDLVSRTGAVIQDVEQTNLVATTNGEIAGLKFPSASSPVSFAAGIEYREEFGDFQPDSVLGPDVSGFNQSLPISGRFSSSEVFGELYVPIIEGAAFAEELSFNGAYRYSDYSTVGGVESYAAGVEWAPVTNWRFRAQLQRAVRAPNINELFSPQVNGFPGAQDPCSGGSNGSFDGAASTTANCVANGVPSATVGTPFNPNSQVEGLFGGNPDLAAETGDTITVGFVAQPDFLPGLTMTVDYYQIEVQDYISTIPVQVVLDGCAFDGNTAFCDLINRRPDGRIFNVELTNQNVAFQGSEGIDIQVEYGWDAGEMGSFTVDFLGGYKLSSEFQSLPTESKDDCTGYFGATYGRCGEPEPEWKHSARLDWAKGDLLTSLRWRYIGKVEADDFIVDSNPDLFVDSIDAYNFFDLSAQYDVNETISLSGGILNLTDEQPPQLGDCCSEQANTWPATYNPLGRQFFVGAKAKF